MSKETKDEEPKLKFPKIEDEKRATIPQLNEDIFGRILNFVVEEKQHRILDVIFSEQCGTIGGNVLDDESVHKQYTQTRWGDVVGSRNVKWPQGLESNSQRLVFHNNVKMFPNVTLGYSIEECDPYSTNPEFIPYPLPKNPDQFLGVLKHFGLFYVQVWPCDNHHTMSIDQFKKTITSRDEIRSLMIDHKRCWWKCFWDIWDEGYNPYDGSRLYPRSCYSPGGTLVDKPDSDSEGENQCATQ